MSDKIIVGQDYESLKTAPKRRPIRQVEVMDGEGFIWVAASATEERGDTLYVECPWGDERTASYLLGIYDGYEYQPFEATGVTVSPAAEIGDALSIGDVYGGFYGYELTYNGVYSPDLSAPEEEEIDHEYKFEPHKERQYHRTVNNLSARISMESDKLETEVAARTELAGIVEGHTSALTQQADSIAAKVSKEGGDAKSFSWALTDSSWTVKANSRDVFQILDGKTIVHGDIFADGGEIGGFTIENGYLQTQGATFADCPANGFYLGPEGMNLGGRFVVDNTGALFATTGTFKGAVQAGSIKFGKHKGEDFGTLDGEGVSKGTITGGGGGHLKLSTVTGGNVAALTLTGGSGGNLALKTVGTSNTINAINSSLARADTANDVLFGSTHCANLIANGTVSGNVVNASTTFQFGGYTCKWGSVYGVPVITRI